MIEPLVVLSVIGCFALLSGVLAVLVDIRADLRAALAHMEEETDRA